MIERLPMATAAPVALALLLGCWAMREAWRGQGRRYVWIATFGLSAAFVIATSWLGAEVGIAIAVLLISPAALVIVALSRTARTRRPPPPTPAVAGRFPYADIARVGAIVLTMPLALAIGGTLAVLLPFDGQHRVVVTLYLLPIVWAVLIASVVSAKRLKRFFVAVLAIAALCAAVLTPRLV